MAKFCYGLDIGSHTVKLVQVARDETGVALKGYALREIYAPDQEYDTEGPPPRLVQAALRDAFRELKVNPKRARNLNTAIGGKSVAVKQIRSIPLSPEEMESSLTFEARKHLPLDDSDAVLDYQVLAGDAESSHLDLLLVATTRRRFNEFIELLRSIGIRPKVIEAEVLSISNTFFCMNDVDDEAAYVFVHVGASYSSLTVVSKKSLFFTRDFPWGGYNFTDDIRAARNLAYSEAERFKKEFGVFSDAGSVQSQGPSIALARKMTQDQLADEIRRSLRYYAKESGVRDFQTIYLTGGSARIAGLDSYLAQALSMSVEVYNPLEKAQMPLGFPQEVAPQLAPAFGAALRGLF